MHSCFPVSVPTEVDSTPTHGSSTQGPNVDKKVLALEFSFGIAAV